MSERHKKLRVMDGRDSGRQVIGRKLALSTLDTAEKPRERDLSDEGKRRAVKWSVSSFNGSNG